MKKFKVLLYFMATIIALSLPLGVLGSVDNQTNSGIWVVKFKDSISTSSLSSEVNAVEEENNCELQPLTENSDVYYTTDNSEVAEDMEKSDSVEYVEESGYSYISFTPNDPFYASPFAGVSQYALSLLNAAPAWDITKGKKDVNIVVIDSGFNYQHEDGANIVAGKDYITGDINTSDCSTHGTSCAGVIGATFNNGTGIAGAAPDCNITMLRCFKIVDAEVKGDNAAIAAAIRDAVDIYEADVISMSFGSAKSQLFLEDAVKYAYNKGAIMVAATGNRGDKFGIEKNMMEYPAAYNQVIGVGSVDKNKSIASSSTKNSSVYVSAPGDTILTLSNPEKTIPKGQLYHKISGTSLATPYVASLAGLARSVNPSMSQLEFRALLRSSVEDLGNAGYDYQYGYGLIDYNKLLTTMTSKFLDVPDNEWYSNAVYSLKNQDILNGRTPYLFEPENKVKRGEFIKILAKVSKEDVTAFQGTTAFTDVPANEWYTKYINWGVSNKIIKGFGDNKFQPESFISREEMSSMVSRYATYKGISLNKKVEVTSFIDDKEIADWAKLDVYSLVEAGVINGYPEGNFKPQFTATRAETAMIVDRFQNN